MGLTRGKASIAEEFARGSTIAGVSRRTDKAAAKRPRGQIISAFAAASRRLPKLPVWSKRPVCTNCLFCRRSPRFGMSLLFEIVGCRQTRSWYVQPCRFPERPGQSAARASGGTGKGAGGPFAVLRDHTSTIWRVQFKAAHFSVSSSNDHALGFWDRRATGDAVIVVIDGHVAPLTCSSTTRGANPTIVTGAADGAVNVGPALSFAPVHELAGHAGAVSALHRDRCDLLSVGADGIVREHNMGTGELEHEHTGHSGAITAMTRSTFAMLTASWDHSVRL